VWVAPTLEGIFQQSVTVKTRAKEKDKKCSNKETLNAEYDLLKVKYL